MLLETIQRDSLEARKARESEKATTLVTLFAEASRPGKDAGNRTSTDEEVIKVVRKFIKGLDDSLQVLTQPEAIARAQREKHVLSAYLPSQLSGEALVRAIEGIVAPMVDKSAKSMGLVMNALRTQYGGAYDGAEASKLVKSILIN
jgi:uncharacterized protein